MKERKRHREREEERDPHVLWSGTISFGLVSVPVNIYPASKSQGISLKMLDQDGTPLSRRYWCPEHGKFLDREEIVRGFEVEEGKFVVVKDEELEALEPRKSRDIDLRLFVPRDSIDRRYFERAYFLTPAGDSDKAYRLLAKVMEESGHAGIATFVMRMKEYLVAILAEKGILIAELLRFHHELRSAEQVGLPRDSGPEESGILRIEREISRRAAKGLVLDDLEDPDTERLLQLVERKKRRGKDVVEIPEAAEGEEPSGDEEEGGGEIIDLMEVLKRSLRTSGGKGKKGEQPAGKRSGRKGMEELSREDLYEKAKRLNIAGRSSMSKEELIEAIERAS
jgi:DNA end-binding protein Ku